MWPKTVHWEKLRFGVEIEFVGGAPAQLELLPGWVMSLDELQIDDAGEASGSELKPPPMLWEDREQIRVMLARLKAQGAQINWSCGLHVHVGLAPWGQDIVVPLLDAALQHQHAIQDLVQTSPHRQIFCSPVTDDIRQRFMLHPCEQALLHRGRPQSHRCGINTAAWFDIGTVEIRYANGTLDYDEVLNTVELCLRFVAAVGEARMLPSDPRSLALALGAPVVGYPAVLVPPKWFQERMWLEDSLIPALSQLAFKLVPNGEIHHILPVPDGFLVAIEDTEGQLFKYVVQPPTSDWKLVRQI